MCSACLLLSVHTAGCYCFTYLTDTFQPLPSSSYSSGRSLRNGEWLLVWKDYTLTNQWILLGPLGSSVTTFHPRNSSEDKGQLMSYYIAAQGTSSVLPWPVENHIAGVNGISSCLQIWMLSWSFNYFFKMMFSSLPDTSVDQFFFFLFVSNTSKWRQLQLHSWLYMYKVIVFFK